MFATWDEFDAWRGSHGKQRAGATRIAVGFYKSTYYSGDTELLDAVIAAIERRGAEAIPMFGYPGAVASRRLLLDGDGRARADAMLGIFFNFADPEVFQAARRWTFRSSTWSASTVAAKKSGAPRRRGCRCSKAPFRWPLPSWPGPSRRRSSAARKR